MKKGLKSLVWQCEKCSPPNICEYCGHVRCDKCLPDRWPRLADGCCNCLARLLKQKKKGGF
jgi:hypothetical protein